MSLRQTSVFRTRSLAEPTKPQTETNLDELLSSPAQLVELTKTEHYCVSKLPALPSVFENQQKNFLNAYSDHGSNYSIVVSDKSIHVWKYKSIDATPLSIEFPIDTSADLLPLAILTRPSNGNTSDPGLVIVDSSTGLVNFYESVQHAPALGLINNKLLELTIPLNASKGEYITMAENIEPAGIAIATSWRRVILISLRDFKGKPNLSYKELLKPRNIAERFLGFFSGGFNDEAIISNDDIVCIKSGKISNSGLTQEIIVMDSTGGFNLFLYQLVSANGSAFVDRKKSFLQIITPHIKNSFETFLPGSSLSIHFLDIAPIPKYDNVYLTLCHVHESFAKSQNKELILVTIKVDSTGALVYGSHKLLTYVPNENQSFNFKPNLLLPNPGKTVFVTVDNSIFITEIDTSYIESTSSVGYYKPRWEDVVRLKPTVEIIGFGYENASSQANPAVIILTKNCGIFRLEKFQNDDEINPYEEINPLVQMKSHIEQAIFYSSSQEINFDLVQTYSEEVVIEAVELIVDEILNSTSKYMVEFLPTIGDSLAQKIKLFQQLLEYSQRNFSGIVANFLQTIVEPLEKVEVALNLWVTIDQDHSQVDRLKKILKDTLHQSKEFNYGAQDDVIRKFFSRGLGKVLPIITTYIERLVQEDIPMKIIINLVVQTQYNGVILNERKHISGQPILSAYKLWVFDSELLIRIEELFIQNFDTKDVPDTISQGDLENLVHYVEVLYYYCTNAIMYMEQQDNDQLKAYKSWYSVQRHKWINILLNYNLSDAAISIAEENQDFSSVSQVLDDSYKKILDRNGEYSHEMNELKDKYIYYFEQYGYSFASSLYGHYLKHDDIQPILLQFTNYKHHLYQYFQANKSKVSNVAWIRYLLDKNFALASDSLLIRKSEDSAVENLLNLELKYSLAKLSAIASNGFEAKVEESENHLIQIRIQKQLYKSFLEIYREPELIKLSNENFNKKLDYIQVQKIIEPSFERFKINSSLKPTDLINYLTLVSPKIGGVNQYSQALRIASLLSNEAEFQYYAKIIWLRLLTIGDDWNTIIKSNSSGNSLEGDEKVKKRTYETIFYKTLTDLGEDEELIDLLNQVLKSKGVSTDENIKNESLPIKTINKDLSTKLNTLLKLENFQSWISSIQYEAKRNV